MEEDNALLKISLPKCTGNMQGPIRCRSVQTNVQATNTIVNYVVWLCKSNLSGLYCKVLKVSSFTFGMLLQDTTYDCQNKKSNCTPLQLLDYGYWCLGLVRRATAEHGIKRFRICFD